MNTTLNQALSIDTLKRVVPSIFTTSGSEKTSSKYVNIPTIEIVNSLQKEGFYTVKAQQSRTRIAGKKDFAKHLLRFRHIDAKANDKGLFPEIVLINSHDGLSSYRLSAGIYRLICSNGLVAGQTFEEVRIKHQGNIIKDVIDGSHRIIETSHELLQRADFMSGIELDSNERKIFSEAVHQLRFDEKTIEETGIKPEQFLTVRRYQEKDKNDLFTVFNVCQENVIRGGLSGYAIDEKGLYRHRETGQRMKKVSTREITSIDQNNNLNRALWTLAEKMAELKGHKIAA